MDKMSYDVTSYCRTVAPCAGCTHIVLQMTSHQPCQQWLQQSLCVNSKNVFPHFTARHLSLVWLCFGRHYVRELLRAFSDFFYRPYEWCIRVVRTYKSQCSKVIALRTRQITMFAYNSFAPKWFRVDSPITYMLNAHAQCSFRILTFFFLLFSR